MTRLAEVAGEIAPYVSSRAVSPADKRLGCAREFIVTPVLMLVQRECVICQKCIVMLKYAYV
jgi:hypothetical protein